ncbi:MAG: hypothetical protein ACYDHY_18065 [Acidiferrobacterales bacterium]
MNRNFDNKKQLPFDRRKENLIDVSSSRESAETRLRMRDGKCVGTFMGLAMTRAFQPIFSGCASAPGRSRGLAQGL